jgi:hypothetical protein
MAAKFLPILTRRATPDARSQPLTSIQLQMTDAERSLFQKYLSKARYYLEYGCGGSTEFAVALGCGLIVSVESDPNWVKTLQENPAIAQAIAHKRLTIEYIDIGPVGAWGAPKDHSRITNWPSYFLTPFTKYDYPYDVILIDGRFRNACAYASWAFMQDNAALLIHDYTVRHSYHDIEKFFDLVDTADTLAVMRKKTKILPQALYISVLRNLFTP